MSYIVTTYWTPDGTDSRRMRIDGTFREPQLAEAIIMAEHFSTGETVQAVTVTRVERGVKKLHGAARKGTYVPTVKEPIEPTLSTQWPNDDLVTIAGAARRLGLSNLSDYKAKYADFPQPERTEFPQLWSWGSIQTWYNTTITKRGTHA